MQKRNFMNEYVAAFVDEFANLGVTHVVVSPGSRSTTVSMLFMEHGNFTTYMNVDERSAAFMALGIAKGIGRPVVLVCTSGSAMAHYLPALLEAQYSGVPLIVLSADRPHTLHHVGAPQTIDQHKLFGAAVNYYEELTVPQEEHYYTYPRLVARKAYMKAIDIKQGPVHINVPLFEPLVPDLDRKHFEAGGSQFTITRPRDLSLDFDSMMECIRLFKGKSFLVLAGPNIPLQEREAILRFAKQVKAPVLADPLSNMRYTCDSVHSDSHVYKYKQGVDDIRSRFTEVHTTMSDGLRGLPFLEQTITSYDAFLKNKELWDILVPDVIVQFGDMVISKRVQQFLAHCKDAFYIVVNPTMDYMNPLGTANWHIQGTAVAFNEAFSKMITSYVPEEFYEPNESNKFNKSNESYVSNDTLFARWKYMDVAMRKQLNTALQEPTNFEGRTICELQKYMPEGGQIMIANSMSIRDFDYFWDANCSDSLLYGNRGVNGIDGTISTALGLAANGKPTVLVTGDLSMFHDLNGLAVANTHQLHLTIILHNNDGGGIFEYLPQKGTKHFEYLFSTAQGLDYRSASTLYGCGYTKINTPHEFSSVFSKVVTQEGVHIIEIPTNKNHSYQLHQTYTSFPIDIQVVLRNCKGLYTWCKGDGYEYEDTHIGTFYFSE